MPGAGLGSGPVPWPGERRRQPWYEKGDLVPRPAPAQQLCTLHQARSQRLFFRGVQIIVFSDISRYILLCMANQQQQITKQTLPAHPFGWDIFSRKSKGLEADLGCSGEPF